MAQALNKNGWEQHFITIANSVIVAGIMFLGSQVWTTNTKLTEITVANKYLVETVQELKADISLMNNNYVKKDEFKDLEVRVRRVEQRVK